jgi:exportin-1
MDVMLENIEKRPDVADKFYLSYFCFVLESILHVIFDGFHKGGFKFQCRVLMRLIRACLTGVARSQLFPALPGSNPEALFQYMSEACASLFKAVTPERTSYYMQQQFLAAKEGDEKEFKRHLRDYMIESSKGSS